MCLTPLGGLAEGSAPDRLSGSAYFDRGYSVYAVVEHAGQGLAAARVALQFAPDYTTNDDIVAYQLQLDDGTAFDLAAESPQSAAAPTSFVATIDLPISTQSLWVVPVLGEAGRLDTEAVRLTPAEADWERWVGTQATVRNAQSNQRLNLRCAPLADAAVSMQYYNGTPLVVNNVLPDGWVAVSIAGGDTRGYMKADFLAFGEAAAQVTPAMPRVRAEAPFVLYSSPSNASMPLSQHGQGTEITVLGLSTTWYHAEVDGVLGYALRDTANPSAAEPPSAAAPSALRTYSAQRRTDSGYFVDAVVTEASGGQFIVHVTIQLPPDLVNDVVVGYHLYVNGAPAAAAERTEWGEAAPTRFKGAFAFAGEVASLRLVPVLEVGGEHTNADEAVDFI
jgi:hypothetical protein